MDRRSILKRSGAVLTIPVIGSINVAGSSDANKTGGKFEELLSDWERRYGDMKQTKIIDGETFGETDVLHVKLCFEDGTEKSLIVYFTNAHCYVRVEGNWYNADNVIRPNSPRMMGGINGPIADRPGFDPGPPAVNAPKFNPGETLHFENADDSAVHRKLGGVGKWGKRIDKGNYRAEAFTKGALLDARGLEVDLWNTFETGSFSKEPIMKVSFGYDWSARSYAFIATSLSKCRFVVWNVDDQKVEDGTKLFKKQHWAGGWWNDSDEGTESIYFKPSENTTYQVGFRISARTIATSGWPPSSATSDIYNDDSNDHVEIDGIDLSWM